MPKAEIFFWGILAFFLGIFLASFKLDFVLIFPFFGFLASLFLSFKKPKLPVYFLGFFSLLVISGAFYFHFYSLKSFLDCGFHPFLGKEIKFVGKIIEIPEKKNGFYQIKVFSENPSGKILLKIPNFYEFSYGDVIEIEGKLKKAPSFFEKENIFYEIDFPKIKILSQNEGNFLKKILFKISSKIQENLSSLFLGEEGEFAKGIILGRGVSLSKQFKEKLNLAGLSHIVALSGFNVSIISHYLFHFLIFFFPRVICFWISLFLIFGFVLMTGALLSCLRAGIMAGIYLFSLKSARQYHPKYSLFLAAFLMVLFNPKLLCFDLGFQLSFLATLGLIYLTPSLKNFYLCFKAKVKKDFLRKILENENFNWFLEKFFFPTLAAQIMVFPLILKTFSQFPLIGFLSNLFILPLIPFSMLFSFLLAILKFFSQNLAIFLSFLAFPFFKFQLILIDFFSKFPPIKFPKEISLILCVFFYLLILKIFFIKK